MFQQQISEKKLSDHTHAQGDVCAKMGQNEMTLLCSLGLRKNGLRQERFRIQRLLDI